MCGLPYCMLRLEGDDSRSSAIICEVLVPENSLFGGKNFCDFHFFFFQSHQVRVRIEGALDLSKHSTQPAFRRLCTGKGSP